MSGYIATFSRGEKKTIANSTREYRAAWLIEVHDTTGAARDHVVMGFSATRAMAEKAAQREFTGMNSTPRWRRNERGPARWTLNRVEVIDLEQGQ